ncbi:PREDICTED: uncharacterized protein LOC106099990 [Papilio polytes]|uniref:uncharacterized protein LOC106099990 n=1 Tax=Papilio polytes TaxID=76194 RepID=UPI0006769C9D|nr:PREDICTED: uncharacterized protein LOC106099990 [Papilio polytes]
MGDESCDVVFLGSDGSQTFVEYPDRPIIKLFEKLIGNDTKQNTVLTNAQIINILHKEFGIEVEKVTFLEIEIMINIIKKYLKDWPGWDKFEKDLQNLETQKENKNVKTIIEVNCLELKDYLQSNLNIAKLLLDPYLNRLPHKEKGNLNGQKTTDDEKIIMEVCSTKNQLNNLILRHPKHSNHIFNTEEPRFQNCLIMPLKAMLHWGGINIIVKLAWSSTEMLSFRYENRHKSKFTLVNKKLPNQTNKTEHVTKWQMKCKNQNKVNISVKDLLNIIHTYSENRIISWQSIFQIIYDDLKILTKDMPSYIDLPVEFRKHLSKYSYVRYMYKEVTDSIAVNGENYDLQLEEMVTPICYLHIDLHKAKSLKEYFSIECDICKMELKGKDIKYLIDEHFTTYHIAEPDLQCVNCNTQISARELANMNWQHNCPS